MGIKEMEDEYDVHMKRYVEELEHEDRLIGELLRHRRLLDEKEHEDWIVGELLRCREQQGQRQVCITEILFQLKEMRESNAV